MQYNAIADDSMHANTHKNCIYIVSNLFESLRLADTHTHTLRLNIHTANGTQIKQTPACTCHRRIHQPTVQQHTNEKRIINCHPRPQTKSINDEQQREHRKKGNIFNWPKENVICSVTEADF